MTLHKTFLTASHFLSQCVIINKREQYAHVASDFMAHNHQARRALLRIFPMKIYCKTLNSRKHVK